MSSSAKFIRRRIKKTIPMNESGTILNVNKPTGFTSFDVVRKIRGITGVKKVGHAGTLDPFATGVLLILVGRGATRQSNELMTLQKRYEATFRFGLSTDSHDITGEVLYDEPVEIETESLDELLPDYTGSIKQVPPMFSAKKIDGKRLYKLARQGKTVEREPSTVKIYELGCEQINARDFRLSIACSKGTYIRSLARDLGEELGTGACVIELERTAVGDYTLEDALTIKEVEQEWHSITA